eukprot:3918182-Karenia_brevis.AAC.1
MGHRHIQLHYHYENPFPHMDHHNDNSGSIRTSPEGQSDYCYNHFTNRLRTYSLTRALYSSLVLTISKFLACHGSSSQEHYRI